MQKDFSGTVLTILFLLFTLFCFGQHQDSIDETGESKGLTKEDRKKEVRDYVSHHLLDSHDFGIFSYTDDSGKKHYVGFALPVILWDNGLQVFSSSKFNHGEDVAEVNGFMKQFEQMRQMMGQMGKMKGMMPGMGMPFPKR